MQDLNEEQLVSKQLVDGRLLKVYHDEVRLPDGTESVREWIDHPGASAVVPLFEDGTTLLLRQFRYPARRTFLEVPAGKLDHDEEDPEDVARRELEEETGWKTKHLSYLTSLYPCIGYSNEVIHFYLAEHLEAGGVDHSEGEFIEVRRLPFAEAVSMARRGVILDMKSVAALLFAEVHLRER